MSVQRLHYLSSMFSSSDCWFVFLHYVPVRLNIPSRTDWDQACVAAKRNSLKAGNERNQSNSLRRITTEGHVCICAWGRTERARTRMCVTHPWVVIEPPQGHGSRQSLACSNNNWGNPTTWAGFITTKEAFIGGNPYSADKQCLCDNSLAADMYTYQSVQNPECVCVCIFYRRCTRRVRCDGAELRGLCLWLRRRVLRQWGELQFLRVMGALFDFIAAKRVLWSTLVRCTEDI